MSMKKKMKMNIMKRRMSNRREKTQWSETSMNVKKFMFCFCNVSWLLIAKKLIRNKKLSLFERIGKIWEFLGYECSFFGHFQTSKNSWVRVGSLHGWKALVEIFPMEPSLHDFNITLYNLLVVVLLE